MRILNISAHILSVQANEKPVRLDQMLLEEVLEENLDVFDPKKYSTMAWEYVQRYVERKMGVGGSTGMAA